MTELYERALNIFNAHMGTDYCPENPQLIMVNDSNIVRIRNATIRELKSRAKPSRKRKDTYAEAFIGMDGDKISGKYAIIFHEKQDDDPLFIMLHELSHVFALTHEARGQWFYGTVENEQNASLSGYTIWKEFIADYIALNCMNAPALSAEALTLSPTQKRNLLQVDVGNHAYVSNYLAELVRSEEHEGFPFEQTQDLLRRQLKKEQYWEIDKELMCSIGDAFLLDKAMLLMNLAYEDLKRKI